MYSVKGFYSGEREGERFIVIIVGRRIVTRSRQESNNDDSALIFYFINDEERIIIMERVFGLAGDYGVRASVSYNQRCRAHAGSLCVVVRRIVNAWS